MKKGDRFIKITNEKVEIELIEDVLGNIVNFHEVGYFDNRLMPIKTFLSTYKTKMDFETEKQLIKMSIAELMIKYEAFINNVSPHYWRRTGTHFTGLRLMLSDLDDLEEITPEQREKIKENDN
jgi:hypothetical protein